MPNKVWFIQKNLLTIFIHGLNVMMIILVINIFKKNFVVVNDSFLLCLFFTLTLNIFVFRFLHWVQITLGRGVVEVERKDQVDLDRNRMEDVMVAMWVVVATFIILFSPGTTWSHLIGFNHRLHPTIPCWEHVAVLHLHL